MEMLEAVILTAEEWTPESGLMTAAQKVQRSKIAKHFEQEIKVCVSPSCGAGRADGGTDDLQEPVRDRVYPGVLFHVLSPPCIYPRCLIILCCTRRCVLRNDFGAIGSGQLPKGLRLHRVACCDNPLSHSHHSPPRPRPRF